jgi:hypothetical protein
VREAWPKTWRAGSSFVHFRAVGVCSWLVHHSSIRHDYLCGIPWAGVRYGREVAERQVIRKFNGSDHNFVEFRTLGDVCPVAL